MKPIIAVPNIENAAVTALYLESAAGTIPLNATTVTLALHKKAVMCINLTWLKC